jgi:hypothetical protein
MSGKGIGNTENVASEFFLPPSTQDMHNFFYLPFGHAVHNFFMPNLSQFNTLKMIMSETVLTHHKH